MMNRNQALLLLTKMVSRGHQQRDDFISIIVDQDDWVGAMLKGDTLFDAMRYDTAQNAVMLMTSDPAMTTDQLIAALQQRAQREKSHNWQVIINEVITALAGTGPASR